MLPKTLERMEKYGLLKKHATGVTSLRGTGGMTRRQAGALVAAATGSVLLSTPTTARAAGEVNFMGWQGYEEAWNAGNFSETTGVTVNVTFQNDNSHAIATATSGGIGSMDIVSPDTAYTPFMKEIGMLQPLDLGRLPNFAGLDPFFQGLSGIRVDGEVYSLPYTWNVIPLMYDANNIPDAPESWLDMLKPQFKGKVALTNDLISVMVNFALAATGTKTPTRITKAELQETLDLIIRIKKEHSRTLATGYGELTDLMATGEVWIAQGWVPVQVWAADKGGNVHWTIPKEGAHVPVDVLALVKDAPHVDDAYKMLDWALSAEAQAHVANVNATGATVTAAKDRINDVSRNLYPYDDIAGFYERSAGGEPAPLWPIEPDGDIATMDDVLDAWDKFLAA